MGKGKSHQMNITYRKFNNTDFNILAGLMLGLYEEDPATKHITREKIRHTVDSLDGHPDRGTIIMIEDENEILGYSLLINFWSNEYGGNITVIDELYIKKEYRSRGIGTNFISYLIKIRYNNSVALQLETTPKNKKARKLYEKLGFEAGRNKTFYLELEG
jgi:ribosomal protein S18 acetylase RimI-like enzyme